MKFRKKPVEIEAVLYEGGNDRDGYRFAEMQPKWLSEAFAKQPGHLGAVWRRVTGLYVAAHGGAVEVAPGDYIVRGVEGELYPCKPDIFAATYDAVS